MARYVAVIDLGKTNSKVALVDTQTAQEIQIIKQATAVRSDGLYPSLDHNSIKNFVLDSIARLATQHAIEAITVTTHGATVALIDSSGELALPVLDYEFQGVDSLREEYARYRPLFCDTGSPVLPGGLNIGAQLFWQQNMFPNQFSTVQRIITWPQYWVFVLTGERHNDVTTLGCHTDLYEPARQRYSRLVSDMGWNDLMPPIKNSGELSGGLSASVAEQIGLAPGVPVFTGIHDSNASLVPHLLTTDTPFSVVSTGTWFVTMAIGGDEVELDESRDTLLNVNARGEAVPSSRFMGGRERELLHASSQACEQSLYALLSDSAKPAMLMPSTVPGTGPYPALESCWVGDLIEHNKAVRDSAIALYLALMTQECLQLVGARGATFIEGPLAHDSQFLQMLAAVTARTVMTSSAETGTSVGAAMLIGKPGKPPPYKRVELDIGLRNQLSRYAKLWQLKLLQHA